MKSLLLFLWHLPRQSARRLITIYQKVLSPDHSFWAKTLYPKGYCKFYPTCSEYMKQALQKYGFFKGIALGFKRIFKCNPWSEGGVDLP